MTVKTQLHRTHQKKLDAQMSTNLNLKKSPGFDLVVATLLENSKKSLFILTIFIVASEGLRHVSRSRKILEVILIPKSDKDHIEVKSYRRIRSKLFEN